MKTTDNRYIRVSYTLLSHRNNEVEEVESTTREQPFQFITGMGYTLDSFEQSLSALKKGDTFDFTIPFADAYGEYNPEHLQELEREVFTIDGKFDSEHIFEGNVVQMLRSDGSPILGTVRQVTPLKVQMDFNHPLAGCDLQFTGTLIESREATPEEVKKQLDGMKGEGCSCCSSDCSSEGCNDACGGGCGHCH